MEVEDMTDEGGLEAIWALLDDAFDKAKSEKYEEAAKDYETWRRTPGMSMDTFIQGLKKRKTLYMSQDDELVICNKSFANRLLTACRLTHKERVQVFINAGFRYEPRIIEEVPRLMYPHVGDQD
eukprot:10110407-Heterocapsa_arctica.AAC.1